MKKLLTVATLLSISIPGNTATLYLDETAYLNALSALGYSVVSEGFENDTVWAGTSFPSNVFSVTSKGITWVSNQPASKVNTGSLGGSVIDGSYGFFSVPHGDDTDSGLYCDDAEDPVPSECWLNDGWKVTASDGKRLYGIGGWFDSNTGGAKITFLLDGVDVNGNDTDNIGNWNRDGDFVGSWTFIGVIDINGFSSAEILELGGKDFQQEFIFGDKFSIGMLLGDANCSGYDAQVSGDFGTGMHLCVGVNSLTTTGEVNVLSDSVVYFQSPQTILGSGFNAKQGAFFDSTTSIGNVAPLIQGPINLNADIGQIVDFNVTHSCEDYEDGVLLVSPENSGILSGPVGIEIVDLICTDNDAKSSVKKISINKG